MKDHVRAIDNQVANHRFGLLFTCRERCFRLEVELLAGDPGWSSDYLQVCNIEGTFYNDFNGKIPSPEASAGKYLKSSVDCLWICGPKSDIKPKVIGDGLGISDWRNAGSC
jgi:hypothetical protein